MTIQQVAEAAGVSASTVSRVLNQAPGIAASTAEAVHRAVEAMAYKPTRRRRASARSIGLTASGQRVGFFIVQHQPGSSVPAYDHLLRGVSNACNDLHLDLQVGFIDSPSELIQRLGRQKLDGLILHGIVPSGDMAAPLTGIPTVWLMGNRKRASWGDQVMPDNGLIGQMAAQYLLRSGHRNVVYHGVNSGWSMSVRSLAFQQAIEDAGGEVTVLNHAPPVGREPDVEDRARQLVETFKSSSPRPTGLFVAEDWLLRSVYAAFAASGLQLGTDVGIISCNNDRPFLLGLSPAPATIDIRFERIAYRGVEQLVNRFARVGNLADRVRIMIEPTLVLPAGVSTAA